MKANTIQMNFLMQPISAYIELTKPRILTMVLVTAAMGYFLADNSETSVMVLLYTLCGMTFSVGGSGALNQYIERETDKKMHRTLNRPLPQGLIPSWQALFIGIALIAIGTAILFFLVNSATTLLVLLAALSYVLIYTPLKKITWWNTFVGAIPGAIPPVAGWAATGEISIEAWVLFGILFAWQHPHFYAIAWMYREDYARGGFKMLPVVEPDGKSTFRQVIFYSLVMIICSVWLFFVGNMGYIYLVGAIFLGGFFFQKALVFCRSKQKPEAKKLLKASIIYLPVLLILICMDKLI
ncbi:heme o synthase [Candidatus Uabimicrobium sp. HlEnr_7]|uniref:heme o synthase n=1 Tax=Candidatus Uabimicrobium helgolandensis TaxID=3095367 RepID=UPI003556FB8E